MHKKVWDKIKSSIKKETPEHAFNTWISPIKAVALNQTDLILEVPNQFFFEWIDTHYKKNIKNKAFDSQGNKINVKYTVSTEKKPIFNIAINHSFIKT